MAPIKVLIADDHQVIIDGMTSIVNGEANLEVVATVKNGQEVLDYLEENDVDVALLDINMPILNGVQTCKRLKKLHPEVKVIALSMYPTDSYVRRMMQYGASGYLLKDDSSFVIIEAIKEVHAGGTFISHKLTGDIDDSTTSEASDTITDREKEILQLISEGMTNPEIAKKVFLSYHTVVSHRKTLLRKLNAKTSAELIRVAMEKGFI